MIAAGVPRRLLPIAVFTGLILIVTMVRLFSPSQPWKNLPLEKIGLGEVKVDSGITVITPDASEEEAIEPEDKIQSIADEAGNKTLLETNKTPKPYAPGKTKPVGSTYTKMLVIPRTKSEDVSWIDENFDSSMLNSTIYVADDPQAPFHPPKNKGHEVMIYLTYIIDHYDSLADVNIFMHSHQTAWHNDDLLDKDAAKMIGRLSAERVQREGYMNMRCHWEPGCPDWMHPGVVEPDINKQEETQLARSWSELFPMDTIPNVLAQPCCAQFAVSKDRIRQLPKSKYVFYRDWLLRTPLSDYISGRVWEYVWHYLFTGQNVVCPKEHVCYCDGFGVCFGGEKQYGEFLQKQRDKEHFEDELSKWRENDNKIKEMEAKGEVDEGSKLNVPEFGKDKEYIKMIDELQEWLERTKKAAFERGDVAVNRAKEVGREWKDGDGF
jgi:hypothetical protein